MEKQHPQRVDVIIDEFSGDHHVADKHGIFDLNVSGLFRLLTGKKPPVRTALVKTDDLAAMQPREDA